MSKNPQHKSRGRDTLSSEIITHGLCQGPLGTGSWCSRAVYKAWYNLPKPRLAPDQGGKVSELDAQMGRQKAVTVSLVASS